MADRDIEAAADQAADPVCPTCYGLTVIHLKRRPLNWPSIITCPTCDGTGKATP